MKLTKNNTAFTAAFMVAATLCAKVCGMLRDILIAAMYGTSTAEAIAFSSASRIPVLFFDIALGSAVTSAFIPIFNDCLSSNGKKKALEFSNMFINLILVITGILSLLGIVFARPLVNVIAGGYDGEILSLIASLVIILFPMIIFTGVAFCFVGILQSFGEFIVPSIISLVSNAFLILYIVVFKNRYGVKGVAIAMLISWSLQLFVQIPSLYKSGYRYRPQLSFKDENIKKVCILALPIIFSSWVQPINNLINIRLASTLSDGGSVAALDYANRLYIILVGVFTYAVTNIIFPALSRAESSGNKEEFSLIVSKGIRYVLVIIVPVMAGFLALSTPIVRLVYERGQFDSHSTYLTASALFYYSLGMTGYAVMEVSNRAFYAMHDGKTPMIISVCGISLNIIMSVVLVSVFKLDLRALAFSAAFSANLMGLCSIIVANKRSKGIVNKDFKITIFKILVSSVIMSVFVIVTDNLIKTSSAFIAAVVPTAVGIATYFVCCMVFKIEEVKSLLTKLTSKFKK
jgi:putative peptidoglycan lipid II flippase